MRKKSLQNWAELQWNSLCSYPDSEDVILELEDLGEHSKIYFVILRDAILNWMHPHTCSSAAEVEVKQFSVCRSPRSVISGSEQAFSFAGLYLTLNISLGRHFSVKTAALAQLWGGSIPLAEEGRAGTAGASTSLKKKRHRTQSSTCQPACRQTRLHMSDHSKLQELGNHG